MSEVAIVTGGSRGIGAEIAVSAAQAGYDVVIGYVDPKKQKRADAVVERIREAGGLAMAFCGDLTSELNIEYMIDEAKKFAHESDGVLTTAVLNAAGGLESGSDKEQADKINNQSPNTMAELFLDETDGADRIRNVVYVTSNPSHFYGHPANVMPSSVYEVVAASKHAGESGLRSRISTDGARLLVATADLVDDTAGATLLRIAHKRSTGDRSADLLGERDEQLRGLIGRGITNAREFGGAIVDMIADKNLPSGHTLYVPRPVLGDYIVPVDELPFNIGQEESMHAFLD